MGQNSARMSLEGRGQAEACAAALGLVSAGHNGNQSDERDFFPHSPRERYEHQRVMQPL